MESDTLTRARNLALAGQQRAWELWGDELRMMYPFFTEVARESFLPLLAVAEEAECEFGATDTCLQVDRETHCKRCAVLTHVDELMREVGA